VFLSEGDKFQAILEDIQECVKRGQPALVGTTSIETSERLAKLLVGANIAHEVLNAKQHEREAHIVAEAGRPGAVTIATNMAGRGTDIVLGGSVQAQIEALGSTDEAQVAEIREAWRRRHEQVLGAGGLHIIAPSATSRGASTTSCAAGRAVRAILVPAGSIFRSKTT